MTNLEVDNSKVICPNCCHQFGAISVSDQKARRDAADEIERLQAQNARRYEGTVESFYCPQCHCARCGNTFKTTADEPSSGPTA